jgi:hexosaminidase
MIAIVPVPRSCEELPGTCDLRGGGHVRAEMELSRAACLAASWLEEALGPVSGARFGCESCGAGIASRPPLVRFAFEAAAGPEGYVLEVLPEGVLIRAGDYAGAVHGAATLRQLALSGGPAIPCCRIEDSPRFAWRGAMLDTARNYFGIGFIERFIDLMALHKLSRFHWHLTDDQAWRLELDSFPELARRGSQRLDRRLNLPQRRGGSYSRDEVKRVVAFAAERGIVVVPEIETPGHAVALLASFPELSCAGAAPGGKAFEPEDRYGIFDDVLCPGNEEVFAFLEKVFDEVAELFPGPWVHAGGDEVPKGRWLSCPRCRARMKAEGLRDEGGALDPERLEAWFMNRVAAILAKRGKRMIGWDEILEGENLRKDAIVMSWRGAFGGIKAANEGRDAIMCPSTKACYLDHRHRDDPEEPGRLGVCTVKESYAFDPLPPGIEAGAAGRILGGQANIWTEIMYFGRQVEYMAFPRLCAIAEALWSPKEKRDFDDFSRRLEIHGGRLDRLGVNRYRGPLA